MVIIRTFFGIFGDAGQLWWFRCRFLYCTVCIHNLLNGTVLIFSTAYQHSVAIIGETHSAGVVCTSQLNYFNIAKTKHASTLCHVQTHEQIYTWVFCEVFVVRNFNFLLVWTICSHVYSFCLLMHLHLQHGVFRHCAICIDCALAYAGYV